MDTGVNTGNMSLFPKHHSVDAIVTDNTVVLWKRFVDELMSNTYC